MRTFGRRSRSLLVVTLAVAVTGGLSLAGPKDKGKGKGKGSGSGSGSGSQTSGDAGGEIEMDNDSGKTPAKKGGGGGGGAAGKGSGSGSGSAVNPGEIEMDEGSGSAAPDLATDLANQGSNEGPVTTGVIKKTPISWSDIVVVVRKPFLKTHRTELNPFVSTTMNDNMIRHYGLGGELTRYLTDVLAIGVEGQYFLHEFEEPFDIVARQARRLPTVNQYNWQGALDFHYVPVYGKFAILDHRLVTWEAFFTAGIGVGQSQVIPRDPRFPGWNNFLIQPNVGVSMRFFIAKWLTINFGIRDYAFVDKFEPVDRTPTMNATASQAQNNADSSFINNIMFQVGVGFWIPPTFDYTTFR
jgi:outer membrane beta-barrel protein